MTALRAAGAGSSGKGIDSFAALTIHQAAQYPASGENSSFSSADAT